MVFSPVNLNTDLYSRYFFVPLHPVMGKREMNEQPGIHTDASLFVFLPKCCCYFGISITILQPS